MKTKITIKLDIKEDAWNWYDACNSSFAGVDWGKRINKKTRDNIQGRTKTQAYLFLIPFLREKYEKERVVVSIQKIEDYLGQKSDEILSKLSNLTKHPICRKQFTLFITTFPRYPFSFTKGYIWISNNFSPGDLAHTLVHELLHFQYIAYYAEKVVKAVGEEKSEWFREAMTPILNDYFRDMLETEEATYGIYTDLWNKLSVIWRENKDFDSFIDGGIEPLKDYELSSL